jgi:hypothetical protein
MKSEAGRPPVFKSVEELQKKIKDYFEICIEEKKIPTIAGLAYELDVDRHTIYNYEKKDEYIHTIKRARNYILACIENRLMNSNGHVAGVIFLAKNYGYRDNVTQEHKYDDETLKQLKDIFG